MKFLNIIFISLLAFGSYAFAQSPNAHHQKKRQISEAYVVLVKEKAQAKGDLFEVEQVYTPESTEVRAAALRVTLIDREINKLSRTNARNSAKLSAAFGDLLLSEIQYEVELFELRQKFTPEYVAVKKKEIQLASLKSDINLISKRFH